MKARTPTRSAPLAAAGRFVLAFSAALAAAGAGWAAEVNGIFTEPATKDLGELTGIEFFKGWKTRGWAEAYYVWNFNQPSEVTVDANQGASIVKGHDISIEGRTFDVHHNDPTLTILELEVEKVPELSSWVSPKAFGFKIDATYGNAYDIIRDTIDLNLGSDVLNGWDRYLSAYSIGYVAPIGRGLRVDFGKLVTHIGGETIESIKNNNFSHGFLYTYAIPFQDTGFRFNYAWSDTVYTEFYALNGWNVTWDDNNNGKTFGPSIGWSPSPHFSLYANYLIGPEQRHDKDNLRQLVDVGMALNPAERLNILFSSDFGYEANAVADPVVPGQRNGAYWWGAFGVFRYKVCDTFEPALRLEFLDDFDGFATGVDQNLYGVTLTLNYRIDLPGGTHLLMRPEYRYDYSDEKFYTKEDKFRSGHSQHTAGLGAVLYF